MRFQPSQNDLRLSGDRFLTFGAEFCDEKEGTTWGHFVASPETYGINKEWVVLKAVPIELSDDEGGEERAKTCVQSVVRAGTAETCVQVDRAS